MRITEALLLSIIVCVAASPAPGQVSEAERARVGRHSDLMEAMNRGDADAWYQLGVLNLNGAEGVPKRPDMAAALLRTASELAHAAAQNLYATLLANGVGAPQNVTEAIGWWRKSTTGGNHWAEYNLGYAYFTGQGVRQDHAEAAKWFKLALDGGIEESADLLGSLYLMGKGVKADPDKAREYFDRARNLRKVE